MWCKDVPNKRSRQQAQPELLQLATRRAKRRLDPVATRVVILKPTASSKAKATAVSVSSQHMGEVASITADGWGRRQA